MPKRFNLRILLAFVLIAGVCAAIYSYLVPRPIPITDVSCTQPWSDVTRDEQTVVFVDGWGYQFTEGFGSPIYEPFCRW